MKPKISVIILTYNEESNIEQCLTSLTGLRGEIFVVDSHSTDKTVEVAEKYGALVFKRDFKNQADQFNWALDNLNIQGDWILRLDADEYLLPELREEILEVVENNSVEATGFFLKRRVYFMGRWIRHGGYYPTWILRLWKRGRGRSEDKEMDEHIVLTEGVAGHLKNDFVDSNRKKLSAWINKHNDYASREARDVIAGKYKVGQSKTFYYKLPLFFRVFVYFGYRYFIRLGFLDGVAGLIFHFLQGFWYRFLIDAKIIEYANTDNN